MVCASDRSQETTLKGLGIWRTRAGQVSNTARTRRSQREHGLVSFRYLVYLNNWVFGERVLKTMHLFDQKTAP